MNEENTRFLIERYPELYEDCHYFDCGDGWFDIIKDLSLAIDLISKIRAPRANTIGLSPYALQVKEKYGTLRYYICGANEEMLNQIEKAEARSAETCEICGSIGKVMGDGWLKTRCDYHKDR